MIQFKVNDHYENHIGKYVVNEFLSKDTMKVTYEETFNTACLNTIIQSRIIENMIIERQKPKTKNDDKRKIIPEKASFYRTLSYLSVHGAISFVVPEDKFSLLQDFYYDIKKENISVDKHKDDYLQFEENKWNASYLINFGYSKTMPIDEFDFHYDVAPLEKIDPKSKHKRYMISSKKYIQLLLQFGFSIGAKHNYEEILSKVPDEFKKDFKEGRLLT